MKVTVSSSLSPTSVTAQELPIGRISAGSTDDLYVLKLSPESVLVISGRNGHAYLAPVAAASAKRRLLPEGTTITITT